MKFGYIDQSDVITLKGKNIGDYIQTIAALQFLPSDSIAINRERMNLYVGESVRIIMASWFIRNPNNFPPSDKISPLFISSHFTESSLNTILAKLKNVNYFKKFAPIGCRDTYTVSLFKAYGIDAYFSGCLTLTLGETFKRTIVSDEILMVDALYNYRTFSDFLLDLISVPREFLSKIRSQGLLDFLCSSFKKRKKRAYILHKIFSNEFLKKATYISQLVRYNKNDDYINLTKEYLNRLSRAKLVVTSRIHCALPCLAIGTPVIFIDSELDQPRISGLKDLFNLITVKGDDISSNFSFSGKINTDQIFSNPNSYLIYKEGLLNRVRAFCKDDDSHFE